MVPCKENDISSNMEETKDHSEVMVHLTQSSFIQLKIFGGMPAAGQATCRDQT